jgi:4-carboxymuconolactone decarboxylase
MLGPRAVYSPWAAGVIDSRKKAPSYANSDHASRQPQQVPAGSTRDQASSSPGTSRPDARELQGVSPALERYRQTTLFGNLWRRPDLSPRDRSIVTLAALIARNQTSELPSYLEMALDQGVTPGEISEIITHLAFYSGWVTAMAAVAAAQAIFAQRGIGPDQLPAASPELLPLGERAEDQRATRAQQDVGPVSQGLAHLYR